MFYRNSAISPHGDAVCEHLWLPGLVLRGHRTGSGLWPVNALVHALHTLFLCLLVQAAVRSLQVMAIALHPLKLKTCDELAFVSFRIFFIIIIKQKGHPRI